MSVQFSLHTCVIAYLELRLCPHQVFFYFHTHNAYDNYVTKRLCTSLIDNEQSKHGSDCKGKIFQLCLIECPVRTHFEFKGCLVVRFNFIQFFKSTFCNQTEQNLNRIYHIVRNLMLGFKHVLGSNNALD